MKIKVNLVSSLSVERFKTEIRTCPAGMGARQIAEELAIPVEHIGVILINGQHASLDDPLTDGDALFLLPLVGGG